MYSYVALYAHQTGDFHLHPNAQSLYHPFLYYLPELLLNNASLSISTFPLLMFLYEAGCKPYIATYIACLVLYGVFVLER
jgi:hypothetical protein